MADKPVSFSALLAGKKPEAERTTVVERATVVAPDTVVATTEVESAPVETATVVRATVAADDRQAVAPTTAVRLTTVTDSTPAEPPTVGRSAAVEPPAVAPTTVVGSPNYSIVVPKKDGEHRMPNYVWWGLKPLLSEQEWYVYDELFGWTHCFGYESVRISRKWLCEKRLAPMTVKQLNRLVGKLQERGLVIMGDTRNEGLASERGTVFTVKLPAIRQDAPTTVGEPTTVARPTTVGKPATRGRSTTGSQPTTHDRGQIEREIVWSFERLQNAAVQIVDDARVNGEGKPTSAQIEREIRSVLRRSGAQAGVDFQDPDVMAVATKWGREGD